MVLIFCKDIQQEKLNNLVDFDDFKEFAKAVIKRTNKEVKRNVFFKFDIYLSSIKNNIELTRFVDFMKNDYIGQDFVIELQNFDLLNDGVLNELRDSTTTYFFTDTKICEEKARILLFDFIVKINDENNIEFNVLNDETLEYEEVERFINLKEDSK